MVWVNTTSGLSLVTTVISLACSNRELTASRSMMTLELHAALIVGTDGMLNLPGRRRRLT